MRQGGSIAGLVFEAGFRFPGVSRFGVGSGLGFGPRRLQARNPQQGSGLPEGLSGVQKGWCRSGSVFVCKATHVIGPLVEEASGILSGSCSRAWETTW